MATKQQTKQQSEPDRPKGEQRTAQVAAEVMRRLGRPEGLRRVDARMLWDGHYRVNVLVGESNATARLAHSFFVRIDEAGNLVSAEPEIARQYP